MRELRWLWRAKRWAARPPSEKKVKMFLALLAVLLIIAGIERFIGWPEWMTLQPTGRNVVRP